MLAQKGKNVLITKADCHWQEVTKKIYQMFIRGWIVFLGLGIGIYAVSFTVTCSCNAK